MIAEREQLQAQMALLRVGAEDEADKLVRPEVMDVVCRWYEECFVGSKCP